MQSLTKADKVKLHKLVVTLAILLWILVAILTVGMMVQFVEELTQPRTISLQFASTL
jgi:hypothetical protein